MNQCNTLPIRKFGPYAGAFAFCWLIATAAFAQPVIEPQEKWSGVFAESKQTFTFDVKSNEAFVGDLNWTYSAKHRTIARGSAKLEIGPDKPYELSVSLVIPPVKEGLIFETKLTLIVLSEGKTKPATTLEKPIWIYSENPFAYRAEWLKELNVRLFDPQGDTEKLFDEFEIPYKAVGNLSTMADLQDGILIVGEGTSLIEQRGLADTLIEVAANGVPVLCLAPTEGAFPLPDLSESKLPVPQQMLWKRRGAIIQLDKRFDSGDWPGGRMISSRFILDSQHGQIAAVADKSKEGWPWMEMQYGEGENGSTLLFCGFGIVHGWNDGPMPRYLLSQLLETYGSKKSGKSNTKD